LYKISRDINALPFPLKPLLTSDKEDILLLVEY
jgi:hypothetical protein